MFLVLVQVGRFGLQCLVVIIMTFTIILLIVKISKIIYYITKFIKPSDRHTFIMFILYTQNGHKKVTKML